MFSFPPMTTHAHIDFVVPLLVVDKVYPTSEIGALRCPVHVSDDVCERGVAGGA
jgi:hypothetical protein